MHRASIGDEQRGGCDRRSGDHRHRDEPEVYKIDYSIGWQAMREAHADAQVPPELCDRMHNWATARDAQRGDDAGGARPCYGGGWHALVNKSSHQ
jgi:hypothetical protein